jgi:hypothetical protein
MLSEPGECLRHFSLRHARDGLDAGMTHGCFEPTPQRSVSDDDEQNPQDPDRRIERKCGFDRRPSRLQRRDTVTLPARRGHNVSSSRRSALERAKSVDPKTTSSPGHTAIEQRGHQPTTTPGDRPMRSASSAVWQPGVGQKVRAIYAAGRFVAAVFASEASTLETSDLTVSVTR